MGIELAALNRVTVANGYTLGATITGTTCKRLTIFVYNNSVLYQLAQDDKGAQWTAFESELPPGFHSIARECSGVRFRNLIAGSAAIVSAKLLG